VALATLGPSVMSAVSSDVEHGLRHVIVTDP
jgi:hypothetical protein